MKIFQDTITVIQFDRVETAIIWGVILVIGLVIIHWLPHPEG